MNTIKEYPLRAFGNTQMKWTSVGLGSWMMETDRKNSLLALKAGMEEGASHIDTAEMYGEGRAEEIVGEAIQGLRDKIFLVSKVMATNASYEGTLAACQQSLKRLKTDYLDIYLLHWRDRRMPLEETFRAFEKLKEEGKIRTWGISNFNLEDTEEAVRLAGEGKIVCNQMPYHPNERTIESKLLPWCRSHGIAIVAYSPFGHNRVPQHPVLNEVADKHNATPLQIVLAFLTRDPSIFAIPKSSSVDHTRDNVQAMAITLTEEEIRKIDAAFPPKPRS